MFNSWLPLLFISALQMLAYLMMTYEAHYPERLKFAFVVNGKLWKLFSEIQVLKHWLSYKLKNFKLSMKVSFHG